MATTAMMAGLGMVIVGFGGRMLMKRAPNMAKAAESAMKRSLPGGAYSKYYRGGFEQKMSRREAGLILGLSPSSPKQKIKINYMKLMNLNHPDKNGSPYLAQKISEAKDLLYKNLR